MPTATLHVSGEEPRTALVAGATGLVGSVLLRQLEADPAWAEVRALVRRPVGLDGGRIRELVVDYERLEDTGQALRATHVFCTLGTTLRKAGSREAFRTVDHDYPVRLAGLAGAWGARHFSLVSSLGADPGSRVFYSRVKGETEDGVRAAGLPSVAILRPSILLGPRSEVRPAEAVGRVISLLVPGRFRGVEAAEVARVMIHLAAAAEPGVRTLESEEIRRLAGGLRQPAPARGGH